MNRLACVHGAPAEPSPPDPPARFVVAVGEALDDANVSELPSVPVFAADNLRVVVVAEYVNFEDCASVVALSVAAALVNVLARLDPIRIWFPLVKADLKVQTVPLVVIVCPSLGFVEPKLIVPVASVPSDAAGVFEASETCHVLPEKVVG